MTAAQRAAQHACAAWGYPEPMPLRTGMSCLFYAGNVVIRVVPGRAHPEAAIRLARELVRRGVRVAQYVHQPLVEDGYTVHALERLVPRGAPDWVEVGRMIRRVHDWPITDAKPFGGLPFAGDFPWWQADDLMREVGDLLDPAARLGLRAAINAHGDWRERGGDPVVCHGDVHPGNVIQTVDGPVVLDWDLMCSAPAAWDHAALLTWEHRWGGEPGVYERFARGYEADLRGDPLAESLAVMRNVAATLMRLRAGRADPAAAEEAQRRLAYWRGDSDAPQWRAM